MIEFGWPWAWLLLPLILLRPDQLGKGAAPRIPVRLATAMAQLKDDKSRLWTGRWPIWIGWLLLIASISQPVLNLGSTSSTASGRSLMLALDLSGSMSTRDYQFEGRIDTRLAAVRQLSEQFMDNRKGDRLGLILFGEWAVVAAPLSYDQSTVREAVSLVEVGLVGRTTAIGQALGLAIIRLRSDPSPRKVVVLLTDGHNNSGTVEPEQAAELARDSGVVIHTIGLSGDEDSTGKGPDTESLKAIAEASGGTYFSVTNSTQLESVFSSIDQLERTIASAPPVALQRDLRTPLLLVLWLLLIFIGLKDVWSQRLGRVADG